MSIKRSKVCAVDEGRLGYERLHLGDILGRKLFENAIIVDPSEKLRIVKADPDDDIFFEAAVAGGAQHIVSQDKHLLNVKEYGNIRVVTPKEFLDVI